MTELGPEVLHDLDRALKLEWLETDGCGGYACGTVVGAHTRRYHCHLMAATAPPVGRRMLVSKLEERLHRDGDVVEVGCNLYSGVVHPQGHLLQERFALEPWPVFEWQAGPLRLRKQLLMSRSPTLTVIRYDLLEAPTATWLTVRPLIAGRDMHHLQRSQVDHKPVLAVGADSLSLQPYDPPSAMALHFPGGTFQADGVWYYDLQYPVERERGLDYSEDLYSPGEISWLMRPGDCVWLTLGSWLPEGFDGEECMARERRRREERADCEGGDEVSRRLALAADQFIVARELDGRQYASVIAGYPWFSDWGRDTMIALPGLALTTRRYEVCRDALRAYVGHMRDGLIPNTFGEVGGEPGYNTVDATLWMFVTLQRYYDATHDLELVRELWPALKASLQAHTQGTIFGIRCDDDGLLTAGDPGTQLTWMDAKVDDWVVTPRHGKAVEINALWYNALQIARSLADDLGETESSLEYAGLARRARQGFEQFWREDVGYCFDCLRPEGPDPALRPNQLMALSLPHSLLSLDRGERLLTAVEGALLTPYGLRTLAPDSPDYHPQCTGDRLARDGAYHQGTVWPWLMGQYVSACVRVRGADNGARQRLRDLLQPLLRHLEQAGLGSVSEILDGDSPHEPRGCFAQAWSVAELLRCWVEYGLGTV